jgi:hypothetical protein
LTRQFVVPTDVVLGCDSGEVLQSTSLYPGPYP